MSEEAPDRGVESIVSELPEHHGVATDEGGKGGTVEIVSTTAWALPITQLLRAFIHDSDRRPATT